MVIAGSNLYLTQVLQEAAEKARDADRAVTRIETVQSVHAAFDSLRYWRADLAVSLLTLSERNAIRAREHLAQELARLAAFDPTAAAALGTETAAFDQYAAQAVDAYAADHRPAGNALFGQARTHAFHATEQLDQAEAVLATQERAARDAVVQSEATARRISWLVIASSVLFGVMLTVLILRSILRPLGALVAAVRRISSGDVEFEPPVPVHAELGEMGNAVLMLREGLLTRAQLEREAEHQRQTLQHAIELINEGFSLYDQNHCLVLCNWYYRELYSGIAELLTPGTPFRAILSAALDRGVIAPADARAEAWIARVLHNDAATPGEGGSVMLDRNDNQPQAIDCRFGDRWVRISERTYGGGTVSVYSDLTELRRHLHRVDSELADARRQQLSMVPDTFPSPTCVVPVELHASMHPAREVGGDFYDSFEVDSQTICIAVGDVSGKGMPAALFMARARSLLRAATLLLVHLLGRVPAPDEIATVVNEELCKNNPDCNFVTLFTGLLDTATGDLRYVNAGHVRPYVLPVGASPFQLACAVDVPLGFEADSKFRVGTLKLAAGDALVVVTDGVADMTHVDGRMFGGASTLACLSALADRHATSLVAGLTDTVFAFGQGAEQADDVTILALRRG